MKKKLAGTLLLGFCLLPMAAAAITYTGPGDMVGAALTSSTTTIMNSLQSMAIKLLFSFLLLQAAIDGYGQVAKGDTEASFIWLGKFVVWAGVCLWFLADSGTGDGLTNVGHFLRSTIDFFLAKASEWVGANGSSFDTGDIISVGLVAYGKITLAVIKASTTNVVNAGALVAAAVVPGVAPAMLFITALMVFFVSMTILASCAYIALKVFMVKLQIALIICASPFSIALLGLKGLRDQGFAPFKGMLALIYRIIILAAIVSAMKVVGDNLSAVIDGLSYGIAADIWTPILAAMMGYVLLAFITHQADGIATSLASGGSGLSSGDLAGSVAAGVAAGMTMGAGAAVAKAATGGKPMSDVIKSMVSGDKGSIKDASSGAGGGGKLPVGDAPKPNMSTNGDADGTGVTNGKWDATGNMMGVTPAKSGPVFDAVTAAGGAPEAAMVAQSMANAGASSADVAQAAMKATPGGSFPKDSIASKQMIAAVEKGMTPPPAPTGDGTKAGIGGANPTSPTAQAKTPAQEAMSAALKTLGDKSNALGHHLQNDKKETHVSINTHHAD